MQKRRIVKLKDPILIGHAKKKEKYNAVYIEYQGM